MFNFDSLDRPSTKAAPLDPLEIFAKTPNLSGAPNDLWKGQAEALSKWHVHRNDSDNAIILNTGAGKSLVGILIAQSLVNENIGPIVYACSTIDLVEQTVRECSRLGIENTLRVRGGFSNDLFETGKAFCITTYQALFSAMSVFRGEKKPSGVIFDDAHVAERIIRDSFTLSINKNEHSGLFQRLIEIIRPEFEALDKATHLQFILEAHGQQSITLCPPATGFRNRDQIIDAFKQFQYQQTNLKFPIVQLFEHIGLCAILVSSNSIEIAPPFIPTGSFDFLSESIQRVYLSATIQFETDFVRGFGVSSVNRIEPDNDAGNGERLILLGNDLDTNVDKLAFAKEFLKKDKLLVSVPSYQRATEWQEIGIPPKPEDFSRDLENFRKSERGAFVLVSRIDGIDLPQDTCRIMLIDGAPHGANLLDKYLYSNLMMSNLLSTKMASRITQLLGRINRGRSDYGAFLLMGKDINNWIKTERNVALLPPLIRKQVILGTTVQQGLTSKNAQEVSSVISQVLARDESWLRFYRETIDGLEVSESALTNVRDRENQLAKSALAECKFMTKLWEGDVEGARNAIVDVLDDTAMADARLAGWYSLWLGMTYEMENDFQTSIAHYKKARSRLSTRLNVPFRNEIDLEIEGDANTGLQRTLLGTNKHGPQALADFLQKLRKQATLLRDANASTNQHEEAVRAFGELLGFVANRPDNEFGSGPDVVWYDSQTNEGVAFELKTGKVNPAEYNKKEIGQALNHVQWLADNMNDQSFKGLLIVGPDGVCKDEASPSEDLFFVETMTLANRMDRFISQVSDTRGKTVVERWALLSELGELVEWQVEGWFGSLAVKQLKQMQAHA